MSDYPEKLRKLNPWIQMDWPETCRASADHVEALEALTRDLADCLEDMTKHYVEVRNDLYGFEAAEEIEVIAAGKLISKAKSQQEGETE